MEERIFYYTDIISDILQTLCNGMEKYISFMCIIYNKDRCLIYPDKMKELYDKSKKEWSEFIEIDKKKLKVICYINNEHAFKIQMGTSFYDANNNSFPVFDLFMQRIVKGISRIISEDLLNGNITTYYKDDKEILLLQSVIDFFVDHELPEASFITYISALKYENNPCQGKILFVSDTNSISTTFLLKFEKAIEFHKENQRLIRKLLEIARGNVYLLADIFSGQIIGVISNINNEIFNNQFMLEFCGHMHWVLKHNKMIAVEFVNGRYYIADDFNPKRNYVSQLNECFKDFPNMQLKIEQSLELIQIAQKQMHGTMIVISNLACQEANRLCSKQRGIKIIPINVLDNKALFHSMTSIDGALMLDEEFRCHAFGVILDGPATDGDKSRGARYNSAITYNRWINKEKYHTWIIIISEDRMVNIVR